MIRVVPAAPVSRLAARFPLLAAMLALLAFGGALALWQLLVYAALSSVAGAVLRPRGILAFGALCIGLSDLLGLAYREMRHAE